MTMHCTRSPGEFSMSRPNNNSDLYSAYFLRNLNSAASRSRRGEISDGVWRSRDRERVIVCEIDRKWVPDGWASVRECAWPVCGPSDMGKSRWQWSAERRCRRPETAPETGWHNDDRYPCAVLCIHQAIRRQSFLHYFTADLKRICSRSHFNTE